MSHPVVDFHYACHYCQEDLFFLSSQAAKSGNMEILSEYACLSCRTYYNFANQAQKPYLITMEVEKEAKFFTMNWYMELGVFTVCDKKDLLFQVFTLPNNITPANKLNKLQTFLVFS
jgi:hypothetical protein